MNEKLTKKQEEVLTFIKKFVVSHGYPPSVREICKGMDLSSPATVHTHLKQLETKGIIRKENSKFRTLELLVDNEYEEKDEELVKVPLLGKISCGNGWHIGRLSKTSWRCADRWVTFTKSRNPSWIIVLYNQYLRVFSQKT